MSVECRSFHNLITQNKRLSYSVAWIMCSAFAFIETELDVAILHGTDASLWSDQTPVTSLCVLPCDIFEQVSESTFKLVWFRPIILWAIVRVKAQSFPQSTL